MATHSRKAKTPQAPKACKTQTRKHVAEDDKVTIADSLKAPTSCVIWSSIHTKQLVEWLENNVEDRLYLFSDSAQDVREDNCHCQIAKNMKMMFYIKIAEYILLADKDAKVRDKLHTHRAKRYGKAVENHISM